MMKGWAAILVCAICVVPCTSQAQQTEGNSVYFASHRDQIRRDVLAEEHADIARGDRKAAAELEDAYQQMLAASRQEHKLQRARSAAGPCWSIQLTLAQIANGMANWQMTDTAGYAAFRDRAMTVAGVYVQTTVSYIRELLQGASAPEQHAAELFVALDDVAHAQSVPADERAEAARLQVEAMNHAPGCGGSP